MPWCLFKTDSRTVGIEFVLFFFPISLYLQLCMARSPWAGGTACRSDTNLSIQARKQQGNGYPLLLWVYWRPQACEHRSHILLQRYRFCCWSSAEQRENTNMGCTDVQKTYVLSKTPFEGTSISWKFRWKSCWLWLRNSYLTGKSPGLLFETKGQTSSNEHKQKLIKAEHKTKL